MKSLSQAEYGELRDLYESIYAPQEVEEDFELSDDCLVEAVEEVVFELIDEGYEVDDLYEMFDDELIEEIIDEAKVTTGSGSRMAAASRLSRMKSAQKIARAKERKEKVKSAVNKVKDTARKAVDEPARKYAEKRGVVKSKSGKTSLGGGSGIGSVKFKQKTSAGRREVRKAVAKDIGDRAKAKVASGAKRVSDTAKGAVAGAKIAGSIAKDEARRAGRKAAHTAGKAAQAVKDAPGKAASAAKRGLKGLIRRGAEKVASGASKVAKRMSEEVETYDVVVEFLCDQGIAENLQEAQWMMVNQVDSEDIAIVLEAYGLTEAE
jgi:hypothetical protein